jgi:hypothetical protein
MYGVWELCINRDYMQSLVSEAKLFFLLKNKYYNLGGTTLLKTACHMPLVSLRDTPSATTLNNDSKKYFKEEW